MLKPDPHPQGGCSERKPQQWRPGLRTELEVKMRGEVGLSKAARRTSWVWYRASFEGQSWSCADVHSLLGEEEPLSSEIARVQLSDFVNVIIFHQTVPCSSTTLTHYFNSPPAKDRSQIKQRWMIRRAEC